jgi:hypothetical protein
MKKKIHGFKNEDKGFHESYYNGRSPANIPKPFVMTITGKPNTGKSNTVKNIIAEIQGSSNKKEHFDEIYVCHGAAEETKEWDILDSTEIFSEIPSYRDFDTEKKKLIIFDDVDFSKINRTELERLSKLVRFGSTHFNINQIYCNQNFFKIPSVIRQNSNAFCVYKPDDRDELSCIGRRLSLSKTSINEHCPHFRDFLFIDFKAGAPHVHYKNLFHPIDILDD